MQKNIYIDIDEEITSILDRIRQETAEQILLAIPQKALITQGVINLKILKKEVAQMNKQLVISTADQQVRRVVERIGIELAPLPQTNASTQNNLLDKPDIETFSQDATNKTMQKIASRSSSQAKTVGSDSFYSNYTDTQQATPNLPIDSRQQLQNQINNPKNYQLNSNKIASTKNNPYALKLNSFYTNQPKHKPIFQQENETDNNTDSENNSFFFRKKIQLTFILLIAIIITGAWALKNYPKIKITVSPNKKELTQELKITSKVNSVLDVENQQIPGKILEVSLEKTLEFKATGESYQGENGRAKGVITIVNNYSSSPQTLVATTRFLSKNGKLFRLIKGVTIPGMQGETPGKIQAEIVADKPGDDFNLDPTTFTIEGFKGGPKYNKFQATSETKFNGGKTASLGTASISISENDLKNAREKTIEALEKDLQSELEKKLAENEKILLDSTEKTIDSATSSSPVNTTTDKFTYTIKETVKTIIFNENDIKKIAVAKFEKDLNENTILDDNISLNYKRGLIDLNNNNLSINLEAKSTAWVKLDLEKIRAGIIGKNEKEIRDFLSNYPGLNQAEIFLIPAQLNKFSTTNKNNVTIIEEKK